jgi:hypothetical protein
VSSSFAVMVAAMVGSVSSVPIAIVSNTVDITPDISLAQGQGC